MRYVPLLLLLFLLHTVQGQSVYYFSSSRGNDGNSAAQAKNPATPWQSLYKLNQVMPMLQPGDKVLFQRGDVFDGTIRITRSGMAKKPLLFSAFGSGRKPVINGLVGIGNWSQAGGNIWRATVNGGDRLNIVVQTGKVLPMGRYPNRTAANGGYLNIDGYDAAGFGHDQPHPSSITSAGLPSSRMNWKGAELCIRTVRWMLNAHEILQHAGNTISYADAAQEPIRGFGFFIQNDVRTLDEPGEWFYDKTAHTLHLWSRENPSRLNVLASLTDSLLTISNQHDILIDNLDFRGANKMGIFTYKGSNITIQDCVVSLSGDNGINSDQTNHVLLERDSVLQTNNNAIYIAPLAHNSVIEHCLVRNSGMVLGLGRNGNQAHEGIVLAGNRSEIRFCKVDSTGYNGIVTADDSVTVRNNFVSNFNLLFDDGAGIYTSGTGKGRKILNNIIVNGPGNHYGTNTGPDQNAANGIGLDDLSEDVVIDGNSIANCSREGLGLHNSKNIRITNNTFYNIGQRAIGWEHDQLQPENPIRDITVNHNIFFATGSGNMLTNFNTRRDFADLTKFGQSDYNTWARPFNPTSYFTVSYLGTNGQRIRETYDLAHWQKLFRQDMHSVQVPVSVPAYSIGASGPNKFPTGNFASGKPSVHTNSPNVQFSIDQAHLDDGCLQIGSTEGGGNNSPLAVWFIDFNRRETYQAGKTYRVRFSIQSGHDNQDFSVLIRGSNPAITDPQPGKMTDKRKEVDLLFTPTADIENAWVELGFGRAACPVWVDNLQIQEVSSSLVKASDYFQFEYNATNLPASVPVPGDFTDLKGKAYHNAVPLSPYSSVILVKKGLMKGKE